MSQSSPLSGSGSRTAMRIGAEMYRRLRADAEELEPGELALGTGVTVMCDFCGLSTVSTVRDAQQAAPCRKCRHQLILAALSSLGSGLPPDKMAAMAVQVADLVMTEREKPQGEHKC